MPVATSRPRGRRTPSSSIVAAAGQVDDDEPEERADAGQERAGTADGADVRERVAGERLAADDREDADDRRDDGHHPAGLECQLHRPVAEEARLEDRGRPSAHPGPPLAERATSEPATTSTRPSTRSTVTGWPYSSVSTSVRTTSSVVPLATRPPAT